MSHHGHPTDDAVRRLPLVDDERVRLLSDDRAKQALFQEITSMPTQTTDRPATSQRARAPRRRLVLAATATSLGLAAAAGASGLFSHSSTAVSCHLPNGAAIVPAVTGDPVADCTRTWEAETGDTAPELVAWDNGLGGIDVLPPNEAPGDGWRRLDGGIAQDPSVIELESALGDLADGLSSACHPLASGRAVAERELARLGMTGWSVVAERGEADGSTTCTNHLLEADRQQVVLIPLEGPGVPADFPALGFARDLADALAEECLPVGQAAQLAAELGAEHGLEAPALQVEQVADDAADCARVEVTAGGRIRAILRGPAA